MPVKMKLFLVCLRIKGDAIVDGNKIYRRKELFYASMISCIGL